MATTTHKGQVLPLANQVIPLSKDTTFHASFNEALDGYTLSERIPPIGSRRALQLNGKGFDLNYGKGMNPFTEKIVVEFWAKPDSVGQQMLVSNTAGNGSSERFYIGINSVGKWDIGLQATAWGTAGTVAATTNWAFVQLVMITGTASLFVDGVLAQAASYTNYAIQGNLRVGAHVLAIDIPYTGLISNFKVLRNNNLVCAHRFDEGEGLLAADYALGNDVLVDATTSWGNGRTVASIRQNEGRYGSAVAIEEGTVNLSPLIENFSVADWGGGSGESMAGSFTEFGELERTILPAATSSANVLLIGNLTLPSPAGKTYTLSFLFKTDTDEVYAGLRSSDDVFYENANATEQRDVLFGGWRRYRISWSFPANYTGSTSMRLLLRTSANKVPTSFTMPQLEEKIFATSYTKNVRPAGLLAYPKEVINPSAGTVSFWLKATSSVAYYPVFSSGVDGTEGAFDLLINKSNMHYLRVYAASGGNELNINVDLFAGWTHVVVTWQAGQFLRFYANGVKLSENLTPPDWGSSFASKARGFFIGSGVRSNPSFLMDELRIDRVAASDSEIAAWAVSGPHYNSAH